jgi:predicted MPP superfamily phosphohydrolase
MPILKRPPNDDFTFRLFFQLSNKIKDSSKIYIWSSVLEPNYYFKWYDEELGWCEEYELDYRKQLIDNIRSNTVVIGIKDHLSSNTPFNPWLHEMPVVVEMLSDMCDYYSDKHFVIFTSLENLEYYLKNKNVTVIPWGGDITNQQKEYQTLDPIIKKNLNSKTTFLSLNRNNRIHRAMLVSLLYGIDLESNGLISWMYKDQVDDLIPKDSWVFNDDQQHIKQLFENGFKKVKNSQLSINDNKDIYKTSNNDNVSNFKNVLSNYYQNTFVEIVSETTYTEKAYLLTEKTLNSIYGCCFPIMISGQGSVAFLREMGFDVFDDVINHNYDTIDNPIDRLYSAINDNLELLSNNDRTKKLWGSCEDRFLNNVNIAKTLMYNFFKNRATEKIKQLTA